MRIAAAWWLGIALVGCAPVANAPIVVDLEQRSRPEPPPSVCTLSSDLAAPRVVKTAYGFGVFNPNPAPLLLAELQLDLGAGSVNFTFEPLYVAPHNYVAVRRSYGIEPGVQQEVRLFYLDGLGHERLASYQLTESRRPPPFESGAADGSCQFPPPPVHKPPTFMVEAPSAGVPLRIRIANPNPYRLRLEQLSGRHPSGSTTYWSKPSRLPIYLEPHTSMALRPRVVLDQSGTHQMVLEHLDGWGRHHQAEFDVVVPEP